MRALVGRLSAGVGRPLARRASGVSSGGSQSPLKAVVFDMDGTLTQEGALDYTEMYRRAGAPPGCKNILEWVSTLDAAAVSRANEL